MTHLWEVEYLLAIDDGAGNTHAENKSGLVLTMDGSLSSVRKELEISHKTAQFKYLKLTSAKFIGYTINEKPKYGFSEMKNEGL